MSRFLATLANPVLRALVAQGVRIDSRGQLCFPDGLSPDRVRRFIELCTEGRYDGPRSAMLDPFARVGVSANAVALLREIMREGGDVDLSAVARHWRGLAAAVPSLVKIPSRFRDFLVEDLGLADDGASSLEAAVESARVNAAERLACEPTWDAILARPAAVSELAAPWRESGAPEKTARTRAPAARTWATATNVEPVE